jgi:predicted nucleotide-binding protein (sugar kinase/HSP70/actin superfamily)
MCPVVNVAQPHLFARQMFATWKDLLGISEKENERAVEAGFKALDEYVVSTRRAAREVLDELERENKIGIVVLGRPYHNDPGINHEILVEFQKLGYPVFTQDSLPIDDDMLDRLFGDEVRAGDIASPMDISDVWKNAYSENTSRKVWAAKYTALHPNLVALEVSNFKCGHDAPIYSVVEEIIEHSGTPYYSFKDLNENRPAGSIKIRVETIGFPRATARTSSATSGASGPSSTRPIFTPCRPLPHRNPPPTTPWSKWPKGRLKATFARRDPFVKATTSPLRLPAAM